MEFITMKMTMMENCILNVIRGIICKAIVSQANYFNNVSLYQP